MQSQSDLQLSAVSLTLYREGGDGWQLHLLLFLPSTFKAPASFGWSLHYWLAHFFHCWVLDVGDKALTYLELILCLYSFHT